MLWYYMTWHDMGCWIVWWNLFHDGRLSLWSLKIYWGRWKAMFFQAMMMMVMMNLLQMLRPWLEAVLQTPFEGWEVGLEFPVELLGHVGMMTKESCLCITWILMELTSLDSGRRKDIQHRFCIRHNFLNVFGVVQLFLNANKSLTSVISNKSATYKDLYTSFDIKFVLSVNVLYKSSNVTA